MNPLSWAIFPWTALHPPGLARGFELAARMKLERVTDDAGWRFLLDNVSREGMHGSWRRAVLLAVVRSEIGIELLNRVAGLILAEDARLLGELIRTVQAVEVRPLSEHLAQFGATFPETAADLYLPSDPSWTRLMLWLISLGDDLPEAATADTAAFFTASYAGIFNRHKVGHSLAHWFYRRLEESTHIGPTPLPRIFALVSSPFVTALHH